VTGPIEDVLKEVEAAMGVIKAGEKLYSTLSEIFGKVEEKAEFIAMKMAGKAALGDALKSGQRHLAKIGRFEKPFNVQGARNSVGIAGAQTVHVFGGLEATVYSPRQASVVADQVVNVKSPKMVEVASNEVSLTAKKIVDVHSSGTMKLVAHPGDKKIEIPAGHTMYLHSKQGILLDSVDKDIEAKAAKNVKIEAQAENFELKAKKAVKATAEEGNVEIKATQKSVLVDANDGPITLTAKKMMTVRGQEGEVRIFSDKEKGTFKVAKEMKLESKSALWKTSGDIEIKTSKLTVNGNKIELG